MIRLGWGSGNQSFKLVKESYFVAGYTMMPLGSINAVPYPPLEGATLLEIWVKLIVWIRIVSLFYEKKIDSRAMKTGPCLDAYGLALAKGPE